jgi:hypothetical protein
VRLPARAPRAAGLAGCTAAASYERDRRRPRFSDNLNDLMSAEWFSQPISEVVQHGLQTEIAKDLSELERML